MFVCDVSLVRLCFLFVLDDVASNVDVDVPQFRFWLAALESLADPVLCFLFVLVVVIVIAVSGELLV